MLRDDKLVMTGGSQALTTGDIRNWYTVVDQVLRCLMLQTPVNGHAELIPHSLWNIEPMEVDVEKSGQASIKLLRVADIACCRVQHTL